MRKANQASREVRKEFSRNRSVLDWLMLSKVHYLPRKVDAAARKGDLGVIVGCVRCRFKTRLYLIFGRAREESGGGGGGGGGGVSE